jgi:hypothetical protein
VVFNANDVFFKFFWEDASLDVTRVWIGKPGAFALFFNKKK